MLRGLYIASALGLALAAAAAGVNYAFLRPTMLRVAVPQGTDDHKLMEAIGRVFSASRDSVRLRIVPVATANASSAALQSESVDIAVVRSDIAVPSNGQTLVILHRNPALLIARGDDQIASVSDLKGKTVGIVRGTATGIGNAKLFDTILAQYEIEPDQLHREIIDRAAVTDALKSRQVDAIFVVGPSNAGFTSDAIAAVAKVGGAAKFIPIAEAKAIAQRFVLADLQFLSMTKHAIVLLEKEPMLINHAPLSRQVTMNNIGSRSVSKAFKHLVELASQYLSNFESIFRTFHTGESFKNLRTWWLVYVRFVNAT